MSYTRPALERFVEKFTVDRETGCWIWGDYVGPTGYGLFRMPYGTTAAHRAAWELFRGEVPRDLAIDHLCHSADRSCVAGDACRHRRCVNPEHLEPVTPQVNTARSLNGRNEFCKAGKHPMISMFIGVRKDGRRYCKECAVQRERVRRAAIKEANAARKAARA